jgi:putative Mn2+ efflux pump MntP
MGLATSMAIAIGLAMDTLAVSIGIGTTGQARTLRPVFRLVFHMGLFQGGMTLLGWLMGSTIAALIASIDHWVAFVLLAFVGGRMIRSGFNSDEEAEPCNDPTRGGSLMMVCIGTSIDALSVGVGLAMVHVKILETCLIIGLVTVAFALFGLLTGDRLGLRFGKRMEILGGLILIGIGLRILYTHLF